MHSENLISATEFCIHLNIDDKFLNDLCDYGLVQLITIGEIRYLEAEQLQDIEKMIRLHTDLEINLEGLDVINQLLHKIDSLQEEINRLRKLTNRF